MTNVCGFPQLLQPNAETVPRIRHDQYLPKSLPSHYTSIALPFDDVRLQSRHRQRRKLNHTRVYIFVKFEVLGSTVQVHTVLIYQTYN
jgi:hypothetical protein